MNLLLQASMPRMYRITKRVARWAKCHLLADHDEGRCDVHFESGFRYLVFHCDHCDFYEIVTEDKL